MNDVIWSRVQYAASHAAGDAVLRHLEETPALNYLGRWYSLLDILDILLYSRATFPAKLVQRLPVNELAAREYFNYVEENLNLQRGAVPEVRESV